LIEIDAARTAYQPNSEVLPLIETASTENQRLHILNQRLHIKLGNLATEKESLNQELVEV
jgi:predicted metal-dependent phosphoesterase TrpH